MRRKWLGLTPEKRWAAVGTIALTIFTGVLIPRVNTWLDDDPGPKLQASSVQVRNVEADFDRVSPTAVRQTRASLPAVEVTLQNVGERRSVITGATFAVRDFGRVRFCQAGDVLALSARYNVKLPKKPATGEVIERPVSQEIGPDQADRFEFRFAHDDPQLADGRFLYRLQIGLRHDREENPMNVSEILVSLPGPPERTDFAPDFPLGPGSEEVARCYEENKRTFVRLARGGVEESPEVERVAASLD